MSTGGAAMNATMKQMVAANRVGIISTPNQPTYRRLLVEVTHSQKFSQVDAPCWRERTELAIVFEKGLGNSTGGRTDISIPSPPSSEGMRDCFLYTLFSLGEACHNQSRNVTFLNVLMYL
jgi:hypothetical protein